ncbi:MAG TPA: S8 family serine peptidase, partial [Candidatus Babeliales bacterium]|nr:S8 family serine peptidase [Candidatus Babeliales bacterium]
MLVILSLIIIGLGGNILNKRIKTLPPPSQPTSSIVKFRDKDTKSAFLKANNLQPSDLRPVPELADTYVVEKTAKVLVNACATVSPQHAYRALMIPNDPIYPQWYTDKISAPAAWDITTGSSSVKIAIIDTGFGLTHEDLVGRWAAGGKDFVHNDNDPSAGTTNPTAAAVDHGSETAGLIGATGNNSRGVASIDWGVAILPLQVLSDDGYGTTASVAAAIHYAVDQGAKVINMSLGSSEPDPVIETELNYAQAHDVVLVAAAGNCGDPSFFINGCNRIGQVLYPAAYSNVIAVGAV